MTETAERKCDHCGDPLGVSVVYDHGKRFHPHPCYGQYAEAKMREMVKETVKRNQDWSMGKYET